MKAKFIGVAVLALQCLTYADGGLSYDPNGAYDDGVPCVVVETNVNGPHRLLIEPEYVNVYGILEIWSTSSDTSVYLTSHRATPDANPDTRLFDSNDDLLSDDDGYAYNFQAVVPIESYMGYIDYYPWWDDSHQDPFKLIMLIP